MAMSFTNRYWRQSLSLRVSLFSSLVISCSRKRSVGHNFQSLVPNGEMKTQAYTLLFCSSFNLEPMVQMSSDSYKDQQQIPNNGCLALASDGKGQIPARALLCHHLKGIYIAFLVFMEPLKESPVICTRTETISVLISTRISMVSLLIISGSKIEMKQKMKEKIQNLYLCLAVMS